MFFRLPKPLYWLVGFLFLVGNKFKWNLVVSGN